MESNYNMSTVFTKKAFNFACIYKLTSPSGKIYIGQTQCFQDRMRGYRRGKCNLYVKRAIDKYGLENIKLEILEKDIPLEKLNEREQFYFDTLQPFGDNGYNICKEAGTTRGRKRPPEEMAGSIAYLKSRVGELNHFYGKEHTKETKQKQREVKLGKKQSKETVQKRLDSTEKTSDKCIKQIDLKGGNIIDTFESLSEASLKTGISISNISSVANKTERVVRGKISIRKSAGGYFWKFCE